MLPYFRLISTNTLASGRSRERDTPPPPPRLQKHRKEEAQTTFRKKRKKRENCGFLFWLVGQMPQRWVKKENMQRLPCRFSRTETSQRQRVETNTHTLKHRSRLLRPPLRPHRPPVRISAKGGAVSSHAGATIRHKHHRLAIERTIFTATLN